MTLVDQSAEVPPSKLKKPSVVAMVPTIQFDKKATYTCSLQAEGLALSELKSVTKQVGRNG
ncbi:MAG: hypothetical protein PSX37_08580 [bacterium]|nr:hypothetical protein [bacterium]